MMTISPAIFNLFLSMLGICSTADSLFDDKASFVRKNGMEVKWRFHDNYIFFEMKAPNQGWIAIGFNETSALEGTYLLMGHIVNQKAAVVEHFILSPGRYLPVKDLGGTQEVKNVKGIEEVKHTKISFSLPPNAVDHYRKSLKPGKDYYLLLAYSQDDDFQHHSIMRSSLKIQL